MIQFPITVKSCTQMITYRRGRYLNLTEEEEKTFSIYIRFFKKRREPYTLIYHEDGKKKIDTTANLTST